MKKSIPYIAIVLSVMSILVHVAMFRSQENVVTATKLDEVRKELDARISWLRDGESDKNRIFLQRIASLIKDVESVKAGQSQFTDVAKLFEKKMESDSELNQVQTDAITKFAEDIRNIKEELNIE